MTPLEPLLSIADVCRHFGLGRTAGTRKVHAWIKSGALPALDLNRDGEYHKYRFRRADIETLEGRLRHVAASETTPQPCPLPRPEPESSTLKLTDFIPKAG